ncbi:hypothetical protein V8E36_001535 [Tilletia maclaganii]
MDANDPAPLSLSAHNRSTTVGNEHAQGSATATATVTVTAHPQQAFVGPDAQRVASHLGLNPSLSMALASPMPTSPAPASSIAGLAASSIASTPMVAPPPAPGSAATIAPSPFAASEHSHQRPPQQEHSGQSQLHPSLLGSAQALQELNSHTARGVAVVPDSQAGSTPLGDGSVHDGEDDSMLNASMQLGDNSVSMASASGEDGDTTSKSTRKRHAFIEPPEEEFEGPISIHKNGGLVSTAFNPYAMPDLDVLATHWSTAARAALRGRVRGLMRFFRISGYLPPPAKIHNDPDSQSRKRIRVSRGYESWKCRACGIILNPVCGETGNARKHISLNKCGGLFAPLESALLHDTDEEVRAALAQGGARLLAPTPPSGRANGSNGTSTSVDDGVSAAAWLTAAAASADNPAMSQSGSASAGLSSSPGSAALPGPTSAQVQQMQLQQLNKRKSQMRNRNSIPAAREGLQSPNGNAPAGTDTARTGADTSVPSVTQINPTPAPSAASLTANGNVPVYQQQADGTAVLVGYNQASSAPAASSTSAAIPPPAPVIIGPSFRAPSALAVASYFVAVGQPPEHAESLAWRFLFDGVPGMPTAQAIRDAMRGTS